MKISLGSVLSVQSRIEAIVLRITEVVLILVTGASGNNGTELIKLLSERGAMFMNNL